MRSTFKVGDKIRFLDVSGIMGAERAGFRNGDTATVHSVSFSGAPRVHTPHSAVPLLILNSEVHNVAKTKKEAKRMGQVNKGELREGDKVVIANVDVIEGGHRSFDNGDVAEVFRVDSDGDVYLTSKKRANNLLVVGSEFRGLRHYTGEHVTTQDRLQRGDLNVGDKVKIVNVGAIDQGRTHFDNGDITTVKSMDSDGDVRLTSIKHPHSHLFILTSELRALERVIEVPQAPKNDRLAEILSQVEALVAEARVLSEGPKNSFSRIEEQARQDVKALEENMLGFTKNLVGNETFRIKRSRVDFQVNTKKRAVTALVKLNGNGRLVETGIARCNPEDTFSEDIGKAIALRRALGLTVPTEYITLGGR